ncbi:Tubulin C-terminal domain family protein [Brugia pahangi]
MSGIISFLRFPGQFDSDLRQLVGSFLEISLSKSTFVPFNIDSTYGYHLRINRMTRQLFGARNLITACNPTAGRYMSAVAVFRWMSEVRGYLSSARNVPHLEQVLNNIKVDSCKLGADRSAISAAFLGNITAMREVLCTLVYKRGDRRIALHGSAI